MKVKDLFKIRKGKKANEEVDEYQEGVVRYIQIEDLRNNDNLKYCLNDDDVILAKENDIIIAWDGANAATSNYSLKGAIGSTLARLRPKSEDFYLPYVGLFIKSKQQYLRDKCTGATIPHVDRQVLQSLEVPLPDYKIQKRIVQIIDKADALRQKRRQTIEKLDEFTQSVFLAMFGDPYHNQKDFPLGTIRDLVSATKYGTNKKAHEEKREYPVIRMGNLTYSGEWDFTDMKYVDLEDKELEKYLVYKGDVLFNRTNSKELVGKTGVYRREEPIAYAGYLIRVRTNEKANSEFLSGFLNSPYGKKKLEHMCKNIVGMANINAQELQDIEIIIPPVELQEGFREKTSEIQNQRKKLEKSLQYFNLLFNSLLQRAFKGKLHFSESEEGLLAAEEAAGYEAG